jgi:hypothetical protein
MAASVQPGLGDDSMLESLKSLVLKPPAPAKTDNEALLERVESGARDRQRRLDAEAQPQADAERQAKVNDVLRDDNAVRHLIQTHV